MWAPSENMCSLRTLVENWLFLRHRSYCTFDAWSWCLAVSRILRAWVRIVRLLSGHQFSHSISTQSPLTHQVRPRRNWETKKFKNIRTHLNIFLLLPPRRDSNWESLHGLTALPASHRRRPRSLSLPLKNILSSLVTSNLEGSGVTASHYGLKTKLETSYSYNNTFLAN